MTKNYYCYLFLLHSHHKEKSVRDVRRVTLRTLFPSGYIISLSIDDTIGNKRMFFGSETVNFVLLY